MDDLREPVDRVLEPVVEAVHEDENLPLRRSADGRVDERHRIALVENAGAARDEVRGRVAGQLLWPLHLADPTHALGRDRHVDVGEGHAVGAGAVEHDPARAVLPARGRDEHVDAAGAGRIGQDRLEHAVRMIGTPREQRQAERGRQDGAKEGGAMEEPARARLHGFHLAKGGARLDRARSIARYR